MQRMLAQHFLQTIVQIISHNYQSKGCTAKSRTALLLLLTDRLRCHKAVPHIIIMNDLLFSKLFKLAADLFAVDRCSAEESVNIRCGYKHLALFDPRDRDFKKADWWEEAI